MTDPKPDSAQFLNRYRIAALALAVSAVVHAAVFVGMPARFDPLEEKAEASYSATLDSAPDLVAQPAAAAPAPKRAAKPRARPRLAMAPAPLLEPIVAAEALSDPAAAMVAPVIEPVADAAGAPPKPDVLAMAQPAAPVPALAPPQFPVQALPSRVSISYSLTSSFADGRAVYNWQRDGDKYTITSEAEAIGFFTLFLEGRVVQESTGTVTAAGLRPERFEERKPNTAKEGLEFDWAGHKVTFDRNNEKKTEDLADNTVDWLSMIFQMAHVPPSGESYDLRVYTQRKLYKFNLKILGEEEIEIPIGKVRALHLRHVDPEDGQAVDVWLGTDQHYLPVKLRYPVARNRLTVEQAATSVTAR
jgi:hypothetical protein